MSDVALIVAGWVIGAVIVLGGLSWLNARITRRNLPPAQPTRNYASGAELTPWGELGNGAELLPPAPPVIRIPQPPAAPAYEVTTQRAQRQPTAESDFAVPALQAIGTATAVFLILSSAAWLWGWPFKVVAIGSALALGLSWFWRLGIATRLLWAVESFVREDLDGDGATGRPGFTLLDPRKARDAVASSSKAAEESERRAALLAFYDKALLLGTSEGAHGVSAANRAEYTNARDTLMRLGLAQWRNPARPRAGWILTYAPGRADEAREVIARHVL